MAPTAADRQVTMGRFRGHDALQASELPPRLLSLASWFHRICDEPAAIWWAAGQQGVHPKVVELIVFALSNPRKRPTREVRSAWRYLFEGWSTPENPDYTSDFALKAALDRDGWTKQHLRRFAEVSRAKLTVSRPYWRGQFPAKSTKLKVRDLVDLEVRYHEKHVQIRSQTINLATLSHFYGRTWNLPLTSSGKSAPSAPPKSRRLTRLRS